VIRICSKCGALLLDDTEACSFCSAPVSEKPSILERVAARANNSGEAGREPDPDWRLEVSRRLEQYRARRGMLVPEDGQSGLPFLDKPASLALRDKVRNETRDEARDAVRDAVREETRERPRHRPLARNRQSERVDINIQPELDFYHSHDDRARPQTALVPVASLSERRWAAAIDTLCLAFTFAAFLGMFLFLVQSRSGGGQLTFGKVDAGIYFSVAYLFYALYFSIFVTFAGATPGMQIRGLSIVRLDGSLPETRQLLWRSFGYLLSGATLMLGFLWAVWDEDHFTWQDRISQTYITAAAPLSDLTAFDIPAGHQTLAHK
jgi:uncharacterized RDD family membrane protein YckC